MSGEFPESVRKEWKMKNFLDAIKRNGKCDFRSLINLAFDRRLPTMCLGDGPHQTQAQTDSPLLASPVLFNPIETPEHVGQFVFRDSAAIVIDL